MKPTDEQVRELYRICINLTQMYVSINLVRLDQRTSEIFILAGDELQITIYPNGKARYL
jgi:hypothetical protein